jgi:predicted transcriptional regulator
MKQITVRLPDELDARLRQEAARREAPIAVTVREAIEAYLVGRELGAAKAGTSGRDDISSRIEEILSREARTLM